jgi:geranylgeranyl pyrophosphate synthase
VLSDTGDGRAVATLADAALCLARGEAMQKLQTHDPATPVDAYLERCALKTGKLIEAACLLGSDGDARLGAYGLNLGIAFQIADDILDCAGETQQTGKIPGTDLRDGTPTLPLLLAAREDEVVRAALAGGPLEGALVRVAATGALERSLAVAVDYAGRARASLDGSARRDELQSLADAVVERNR